MFPGEKPAFPSAKVHEEAKQKGTSVIYIFPTEALLQSAALFHAQMDASLRSSGQT